MNISQLAKAASVSTDTVRYYEKQGILTAPERQANGYRLYSEAYIGVVRFVRGAQSLGFSLAEIRALLPQLTQGKLNRTDIELQLQSKMAQIDAHIRQLKALRKELVDTLASLTCAPTQALHTAHAIAPARGRSPGSGVVRPMPIKSKRQPA